ncbi:MAG: PIN domain-containing protein [Clostridiales bacterium]|jgi:predicted nucleic acid-binding protein|nr:PIN domain-containing protein [Clostridiales bacterium]
MKRVVIDTNVLISSALKLESNPYRIMSLVSDGELKLFYCKEILAEYKRV